MFRLWIFIIQLLLISIAFAYVMKGLAPYPFYVVLGFVGGFLVVYAISAFREASSAARDIRTVRNADTNQAGKDGERMAVVGTLKAMGLPLRAPFSRRECVYYRYSAVEDVASPSGRQGAAAAYSGLALTGCLVRNAVREIRLVGTPMLEGFEDNADVLSGSEVSGNASRYVAETTFEVVSTADTPGIKPSMRMVFDDRDGQVKRDVRLATAGPIENLTLREIVVPVGIEVCAVGTWSADQGGMIQKLGSREILTVYANGTTGAVTTLSNAMKRYLTGGGISVGIAAGLIAWRILAG